MEEPASWCLGVYFIVFNDDPWSFHIFQEHAGIL